MSIIHLTSDSFAAEVTNSDRPVLVDFWAPWCGPCRMMSPVLDEVAEKHPEIKVCKVNVDENKELARTYRVMSIPSLFYFKNGQVVKSSIGAVPMDKVEEMLV